MENLFFFFVFKISGQRIVIFNIFKNQCPGTYRAARPYKDSWHGARLYPKASIIADYGPEITDARIYFLPFYQGFDIGSVNSSVSRNKPCSESAILSDYRISKVTGMEMSAFLD